MSALGHLATIEAASPEPVVELALRTGPLFYAGLLVAGLLLVCLWILRLANANNSPMDIAARRNDAAPISLDEVPEMAPQGHRPNQSVHRRDATSTRVPVTDPVTAETTPVHKEHLITPGDVRQMEQNDPAGAAVLWERLGHWRAAVRCHLLVDNPGRAAEILIALQDSIRAMPLLEEALRRSPMRESLRLRLIEVKLDMGRIDEAQGLIRAISDPLSPIRPGAELLESVGRAYEALNRTDDALEYYRQALTLKPSLDELPTRILFIRQMQRLNDTTGSIPYPSPATEMLDKYIRESAIVRKLEAGETPKNNPLQGHEVVVGHLALGFRTSEPSYSVRSVYAVSRRFSLQRPLGESAHVATFEATDELLDFPVALKLFRIPNDPNGFEMLKERLRSIAQLNHPNLAKITYVDRDVSVLRVATEYLPGGNLRDFITRVGGIGVPLLIRMTMHLASALHSAHVRGVPHGDVRPENILIGHDQRFKLVDFAMSPIPVRKIDYSKAAATLSETVDTPKMSDFVVNNEGVQSDLVQMGDFLKFLLENVRRLDPPQPGITEATEELWELVSRLHKGDFTSVLRLWQVLEQIFERTLPNQATNSNPRLRS